MSYNKPSTNAASKLHFIAPCLELFQTNIIFQFFIKLKRIESAKPWWSNKTEVKGNMCYYSVSSKTIILSNVEKKMF